MNPKEHVERLQARIKDLRAALILIADMPTYDAPSAIDIAIDALLKDDGGLE